MDNNPENRNFFFKRIRDFVKIFPEGEKIISRTKKFVKDLSKKKFVKDLKLAYEKYLKFFEETEKKFFSVEVQLQQRKRILTSIKKVGCITSKIFFERN